MGASKEALGLPVRARLASERPRDCWAAAGEAGGVNCHGREVWEVWEAWEAGRGVEVEGVAGVAEQVQEACAPPSAAADAVCVVGAAVKGVFDDRSL